MMMMICRRCLSEGSLRPLRPTSLSSTSTPLFLLFRRLLSIETTTNTLTSKSPMADQKKKKGVEEESLASPSVVPWLMLSTPQNPQSRYMYDLLPEPEPEPEPEVNNNNNSNNMMMSLRLNQEIHLPEIAGHHCIGSSQGFLITIDISTTTQIHATNPLTGARLPLPSLPPLAHLKVCSSWNYIKYGFRRNWMTPPQPPVLVDTKFLSLYHAKAILSPSLTHIFVLLQQLPPLLTRVGHDTSWTSSSHPHSSILHPKHISDSIFRKGLLHLLWDSGNITTFDLNDPNFTPPNDLDIRFLPSSSFDSFDDPWPVTSLVESPDGDDLFLLHRTVSFPGSSPSQISLNLYTPGKRAITRGFKVFKLHLHNHVHVWRKVECLGDLALFVGHGSSLALSVLDQKKNLSSATHAAATGVFNLGDGSIQFFNLTDGHHNFNWPLPQWYIPTPI